jgi:hypothetical protein
MRDYDSASSACTMYVAGVIDGRNLSDKPGFSLQDGVTYGQELRISIKYMQDHPGLQHLTFILVIFAQASAFFCPKAAK